MKKILTLLAIMMVTVTVKAETITQTWDFTTYESQNLGANEIQSLTLDDEGLIVLNVSSYSNSGTLAKITKGVGLDLGAFTQASISIVPQTGARITNITLTFSDAAHSPSAYAPSSQTPETGTTISGNTVTWSGTLSGSATNDQFGMSFTNGNLILTKVEITRVDTHYDVSTAAEFYDAVNQPDAVVQLTADIDLSNLNITTDYVFPNVFSGRITGENNGGTDYALKNGTKPLFAQVKGAVFKHIIIDNCDVVDANSEFVVKSEGSTFSNIVVKNSSIYDYRDVDDEYVYEYHNVYETTHNRYALVVGDSYSDVFEYCTNEKSCSIEVAETYIGGIAGRAEQSSFMYCHNAAYINTTNQFCGGIVAASYSCHIERCLNTADVCAMNWHGGVVGTATTSTITMCVNTGYIGNSYDIKGFLGNHYTSYRGGICGYTGSITYCMNFGTVSYASDSESYLNWGDQGENNLYYCEFNGDHEDNLSKRNVSYEDLVSGKYAMTATNGSGEHWLYQSIDNNIEFPTIYPVPIPAAGTVCSNILCDGTQAYSNTFQSTASHDAEDPDTNGFCDICGDFITLAPTIYIRTGVDLNRLARAVNSGKDTSYPNIYIDTDIDMNGFAFTPIGIPEYPFTGQVIAAGHRIKNLNINGRSLIGTGLFGCVKKCVIQGIILDKSCTVTQNNNVKGTAGIVGCVITLPSDTKQTVIIQSCGNEADITSVGGTTAGIVGDVLLNGQYCNTNVQVEITNCYNTGNIVCGADDGATIVAFANYNTNINNTWNSGTINKYKEGYPFAGTYSNTSGKITNCYDVNTVSTNVAQTGVNLITTDDLRYGSLCNTLTENLNNDVSLLGSLYWSQNIETDSYPYVENRAVGLHYAREMANQWGTLVLPFDITYNADNTDYNLYYLSKASSDALTFTEYTSGTIAAGTPMAVKVLSGDGIDIAPASTPNISTTIKTPTVDGLIAKGTYTRTTIGGTEDNGVYFIASNKFWRADVATTVAPFRAWFEGTPTSGNAKSFTIVEGDEADGIDLTPTLSQGEGVHKYLEDGKVVIVRNSKKYNINGQVLK